MDQLGLDFGVAEAQTFHRQSFGFFSLNYVSLATRKEAEQTRSMLFDLLDYESDRFDERMAQKHGAATVEQRIIQLKSQLKGKSTRPMVQRMYPIAELPFVISQLTTRPDFLKSDCYLSVNGFAGPQNRQATNVQHLNMLFADIDIVKDDSGWLSTLTDRQRKFSAHLRTLPPEKQAEEVINFFDSEFLPRPSFILWSGGGLHLKWIFSRSVPRSAKPLWDKLQEHLIGHLARGGFPVDSAVRDVSRILRLAGSMNQKRGEMCRELWINAESGLIQDCIRYDFNGLADGKLIMPWSRAEARLFKADKKIKTALWDKNRALADAHAAQSFIDGLKTPSRTISEFLEKDLWHARLNMIRRTFPNGVPEGRRNDILWVASNALAYSRSSADDFKRDLVPVLREICPTFSPTEIRSAAASVCRRVGEEYGQGKGLYKMTNDRFNEALGITKDDWSGVGTRKKPANAGAMGFEKMANLPFDEYRAETTKRRRAAAKMASEAKASVNVEKRLQARKMAATGMTQRAIAVELSISLGSVNKWVSA